jgi:hypothetical protein
MLSSKEHSIKMANDIANYWGPASNGDLEEGAQGVVAHMKRFWNPKMRAEFSEQASDLTNDLNDIARRAAYIIWEEINS